jgi:hypothetical protein
MAQWIRDAPRLTQADFDFFNASARYWCDFLLSLFLAYGFGTIYLTAAGFLPRCLPAQCSGLPVGLAGARVCHLGQNGAFKVA